MLLFFVSNRSSVEVRVRNGRWTGVLLFNGINRETSQNGNASKGDIDNATKRQSP